ncbi:MAG: 30S ribosomal protein S9 [Candidatus Altiarchaeota archaeon]|nr:30S ribosomal protein S9 [Candidatus Altiarchaeota archaeon]
MSDKMVHQSGKRKEAIARTTIKPGTGLIRVNSILLDQLNSKFVAEKIRQPMIIASDFVDFNKIDISSKVQGGGVMGQADAVASSIARGLVEYTGNDGLLEAYVKYDRTLIAGDHRQTEVHKPSQSSKGPRHKRQKSYR